MNTTLGKTVEPRGFGAVQIHTFGRVEVYLCYKFLRFTNTHVGDKALRVHVPRWPPGDPPRFAKSRPRRGAGRSPVPPTPHSPDFNEPEPLLAKICPVWVH